MAFDFDAAVCAPFRMQPGLRRLAPGGSLIQFSYSPKPPVPASPEDYSLAGSPFVLLNLPPARVWNYRPPAH